MSTLSGKAALIVSLFLGMLPQVAQCRDKPATRIVVERGSLAQAITAIARATGAEIVSTEPGLAAQAARRVVVNGSAWQALRELLENTPYEAERISSGSYRVVLRRNRPNGLRAADRRKVVASVAPLVDESEIVVSGKFPTGLASYPGSVSLVQLDGNNPAITPPTDLGELSRQLPILSGTALGEGRDKVFVRGVADSSFNGASQPTTSIYFDDALIGFGSPSPNLKLYDFDSVEVLEGPQGTLFGSGSMGGVIRINPTPVNLISLSGKVSGSLTSTSGGALGWGVASALNIPVVRTTVGIRAVAYDQREGGYIDDTSGRTSINRVEVAGGRLALTLALAGDFQVDASGIWQSTTAADTQYADEPGRLARTASFPQPYSSTLLFGRVSLRKGWESGVTVTSVMSIGSRTSFDRFDATGTRPVAVAYDVARSSTVAGIETRIAGAAASPIHWVAGISLEYVRDGQSRAFGIPDDTNPLDEVTNITSSASLFGQARFPLMTNLEITLGARFTISRTDSRPARGGTSSFIKGDLAERGEPTVALLWRGSPTFSAYGRFQTGYRNGGVTVARGVGRVANFEPDTITMGEVGVRKTPTNRKGLSLSGAVSVAHWSNVLAELLSARGVAISTNVGNARILTVEGTAEWQSGKGWDAGGAFLFASNGLTGDLTLQTSPSNRVLPDVPHLSISCFAQYGWGASARSRYSIRISGRYVGRSILGPGNLLDIDQGDFVSFDGGASYRRGRLSLNLSVENLFNTRASRFGLGNPLMLYQRQGYVPVRPRMARLSVEMAWP